MTETEARDLGMRMAAKRRKRWLLAARHAADTLAQVTSNPISIEDVRRTLRSTGVYFEAGNWMGSVFKTKDWLPVSWIPTSHVGGHRRYVRTWRRK